ncbi:MAG: MotA/TolQ/ExbB proton channel family protein [Pseudomonadales bacterium]|nr:MotA/TolQ/ExbB proton channel family protein [Pseudomonadales bacterium]
MMAFIDSWMPWLGNLLALGGPVLGLILCMAFIMWSLLFERLFYLFAIFPGRLKKTIAMWQQHSDKSSWFARQYRDYLSHCLAAELKRNFALIGTIIKVCPLLGLLGTVVGMLEVFDALANTGSNNPRSMAAGVSKATVSTLAGMVVAIFGLLTNKFAERRALAERDTLLNRFAEAS